MQIYITRGGETYGPYSIEKIRQMLADGLCSPTDLAYVEGTEDWVSLNQILQTAGQEMQPHSSAQAFSPEEEPPVESSPIRDEKKSKLRKALDVTVLLVLVCAAIAAVYIIKGWGVGDDTQNAKTEPGQNSLPNDQKKKTSINQSRTNAPTEPVDSAGNNPDGSSNQNKAIGSIASYDPKFKFYVLNRGADNGIKVGDEYQVIRSGKPIGIIIVKQTQPTVAIAETVELFTQAQFKMGDKFVRSDKIAGVSESPTEGVKELPLLTRHLPDDPGAIMSLKLGKWLELLKEQPFMRDAMREGSVAPLFGPIVRGIESGEVKLAKKRSTYVWIKQLPAPPGAEANMLLCYVVPMDAGLEQLEPMISDELRANGQQVKQFNGANYRVIQNPAFPAAVFAFGKDNFAVAVINDSKNQPLGPQLFTGESGKNLRAWQKYATDLVFVGREKPVESVAIQDFVRNPSDVDIYMDISQLPTAMMGDDPDSKVAMEMLSESPFGFGMNFDQGSLTWNFTLYNQGFQETMNNLPAGLLGAIPQESIALAGVSVDMAKLAVFYKLGVLPFFVKNMPPEAFQEFEEGLSIVKSTTGYSVSELMGMLEGNMVLGWSGLNVRLSNLTKPTPKGVLGISCTSPQKAKDLFSTIDSTGALDQLNEYGLDVLIKDNQLFICSSHYRQAILDGKPLNDGTDPKIKLLSKNGLTLVATTDDLIDFAKFMEVPQDTLDAMELLERLALTGNFERGKQTYQFEFSLKDKQRNSLLALIDLVKPAATAVTERSELELLREKAEAGDADSQYDLALRYVFGDGVPQDYVKAIAWLRKAAEQNHSSAQNSLGLRYKNGQGVKADPKQAVYWWRKAASQGNKFAQNNLSDAFYNGQGVDKDLDEAIKWTKLAAEQGLAAAQTKLAWAYQNGLGVAQDYAVAMKWYRSATDQGDYGAQYNLALLYGNGQGVGRDISEALELFESVAESDHRLNDSAAQQIKILRALIGAGVAPDFDLSDVEQKAGKGDGLSQYHLGVIYNLGFGKKRDPEKALELYRKAAENRVAGAQFELGAIYYGGLGVEKDYRLAFALFQKAALQKHPKAQYNLALMYSQAQGLKRDLKESLKWLDQAMENADFDFGPKVYSDQKIIKHLLDEGLPSDFDPDDIKAKAEAGDAKAQYHLAMIYEVGIGFPPDRPASLRWFQEAAKKEVVGAQFKMGSYYHSGGPKIDPDLRKAVEMTFKAAKQGNLFAKHNLGIFYQDGIGVTRNPQEAIKWFREAAEGGFGEAQNHLGYCYDGGLNVVQDKQAAIKWYSLSAKQGHARALSNLASKYMSGEGVEKDFGIARRYLLESAQKGEPLAYINLGVIYQNGLGTPKNPAKAAKLYHRAATAKPGHPLGQRALAYLHANGIGLEKDLVQAYKWWKLASDAGDAASTQGLEQVRPLMSQIQIERAEKLVARIAGSGNQVRAPPNSFATTPATPSSQTRLIGNGTGFFITNDGFLITNHHVVEKGIKFKVRVESGAELPAKVVKLDKINDLALLKVQGDFKPMPLRASSEIELGDPVFTIGFPNVMYQGFSPKLTQGSVNSLAGIRDDTRYFQISAPVQPGNSGGALVDEFGNVIGVVSMRLNAKKMLEEGGFIPQNVNYAIKGSVVLRFLAEKKELKRKMMDPYNAGNNRSRRQVFRDARNSKVLVLVYGTK
jgi:TPR repeat protein